MPQGDVWGREEGHRKEHVGGLRAWTYTGGGGQTDIGGLGEGIQEYIRG